jgi:hypothetical protein
MFHVNRLSIDVKRLKKTFKEVVFTLKNLLVYYFSLLVIHLQKIVSLEVYFQGWVSDLKNYWTVLHIDITDASLHKVIEI